MNRISMLPVLILAVSALGACVDDASQQNNAQGHPAASAILGLSCQADQTALPDGQCVSSVTSCAGYEGPCNTALAAHPLTGCFAANYKAPIQVGDGQTYQLAVDTGSSNMAVAASNCQTCNVSPLYTPGSSAVDRQAHVTSGYADGSGWSGVTYTDTVHVDDAIGDMRMAFTAIEKQLQQSNTSNVFFGVSPCTGTDDVNTKQGILGLGGGGLTTAPDQAFMDVMKQTTNLPNAFSVHFCDQGGHIWYGGYDPNYMMQPPTFIPMDASSGFYRVTIDDVQVAGASLGASPTALGPSIADTGTGAILLPNAAYEPVVAAIGGDANFTARFPADMLQGPGQCVAPRGNASREELDASLPTLTFVFADAHNTQVPMTLPATSSYLLPITQSDGSILYCSTLGSSEAVSNQSVPLLGNPMMHAEVTVFDRDLAQFGFAPQRYCENLR